MNASAEPLTPALESATTPMRAGLEIDAARRQRVEPEAAGIFHGIRSRVVRGTAVGAEGHRHAGYTDRVCDAAWAQALRADRR